VLVMMLGDMGDALLATPALRRLRDAHPDAHITALTKPTTVTALTHAGLVDDFLSVDKAIFDRPAALLHPAVALGLLRFVRDLRRKRFDTVVLLHHLVTLWGTIKFALLTLATGAPIRAGLDNGRGLFLTHRARDLGFDAAHESEYWLRVVAVIPSSPLAARNQGTPFAGASTGTVGIPPVYAGRPLNGARGYVPPQREPSDDIVRVGGLVSPVAGVSAPPTFIVPDEAQESADALLRDAGLEPGAALLAVHPGSGAYSLARRWFPDRFAAIADELTARHGLRVVLLGGKDERELADAVGGLMRYPAVNLAGRTTLDVLGGVLKRCALLVGNDSGVAHLASAVGAPVVAVFGPFNHHTWRPLGRSLVVRADPALPCMPCVNRGFARGYPEGCPPRYCLQRVTPAMVVAAAEELLGG